MDNQQSSEKDVPSQGQNNAASSPAPDDQPKNGSMAEDELEQLKKQAQEYLEGWKRAKADYLNLKREHEEREKRLMDFAKTQFAFGIIPIFDNLKLAFIHAQKKQEKDEIIVGVEHIISQFREMLKNFDIQEMETVGKEFHPQYHEAVKKEKRDGVLPGIILEEVRGGYMMKNQVIIPAKVVVAE